MIVGYPTEEELRDRIANQLNWRGKTDTVVLLWRGYLSALLEWGLIDVNIYHSLTALLLPIGNKELDELFADEPITPAREAEIDEHLRSLDKKD